MKEYKSHLPQRWECLLLKIFRNISHYWQMPLEGQKVPTNKIGISKWRGTGSTPAPTQWGCLIKWHPFITPRDLGVTVRYRENHLP